MLQQKILSILLVFISLTITYDIYKERITDRDTIQKLDYLNSIVLPNELTKLSTEIKTCAKRQKSLGIYQERLLAVNSILVNFNDSLIWPQFVDEYDLVVFEKEIAKIPKINLTPKSELNRIRNKLIYRTFLYYLINKVGGGNNYEGCFFTKHQVMKDVYNNLSLTNYTSENLTKISSINNLQNLECCHEGKFRIPLEETLHIVTKTYFKTRNTLLPNSDTLLQHIYFDLSQIPNTPMY